MIQKQISANNCACPRCPTYALQLADSLTERLAWLCKQFEPVLRPLRSVVWSGSRGMEMVNSCSSSWATEMRHQINVLRFLQQWPPLSSPVFFILPCKGNSAVKLQKDYWGFLFFPQLSLYVLTDSPKEQHCFCSQCLARMDWGATKGMVKNLGLPSWLRKASNSQAAPVGQKYITC